MSIHGSDVVEKREDGPAVDRSPGWWRRLSGRRRRGLLSGVFGVLMVPVLLLTSAGSASAQTWCWQNSPGNPDVRVGSTTWAETTQQASNTWQDWIWRGDVFQCPWGVPSCSYMYGQAHTTGYSWSIGAIVGAQNNPTTMMFQLLPSYGRMDQNTTTYNWTVNLSPGQYAQPIQVVLRRWQAGDFVGAFRLTGQYCQYSQGRGTGYTPNGRVYYWDGGYRWGSWQQNVALYSYGSYNIWR